jgi:hypothetical protein
LAGQRPAVFECLRDDWLTWERDHPAMAEDTSVGLCYSVRNMQR